MAYDAIWSNRDKLHEFEYAKLERDGLDVIWSIIEIYSKEGYDSIPQDDLNRFKWAGVYQQKPNNGYFMMRIRIPSGLLNAEQAKVLGGIAREFGRDLMDITTRQSVQYHWIRIEDVPDIFRRLESVGLYSVEACGDCPRAIVGNPLAGIDKDELIDTTDIVNEVSAFFVGNRDFSNLPRKYKISISANIYNNANAEIQDLAFTPATKNIDGSEVIGFHVQVGGGLSAKPYLAQPMNLFVRPEEVLKVAIGVTTIFRDYGYREKRHHARMKFLVNDWGTEQFQAKLEEYIGPMLTRGEDKTVGWQAAFLDGVNPQKQNGLSYIGLNVPMGRLSGTEFLELARLSEEYGNGCLRTTLSQNILMPNIPDYRIEEVLRHHIFDRLSPKPNRFTARTMSCTGSEFCNLAIVETKFRAIAVAEYLDEHVELDQDVRINFVGCPNACGHKQIADIGLQGVLIKTEEGMKEAFELFIGGILGPGAQFNEKLKGRILAEEVGPILTELIHVYKLQRTGDENFHQFYNRHGILPFQKKLDELLGSVASNV